MRIPYPDILRFPIQFVWQCIRNRALIWSIFKHNYVHEHRDTYLGFFWLIVNPCIPIFIYNLLQFMGIFATNYNGVPRAIYLTLGLIVYYAFSEAMTTLTASPVRNRVFLLSGGVEKSVVLMASLLEVIANFGIRYFFYLVMLIISDYQILDAMIYIPILVVFVILLGAGIGIIFSVFNVVLRDVSNVVRMVSFYLLFGSGVFGAIEKTNLFFTILNYSPVYMVIEFSRDLIFWDGAIYSSSLVIASAVSLLLFNLSLVGFYRVESKINTFL